MYSRSWLLFLRILPSPVRWLGAEFVRLVHWLDHLAARAIARLRSSPAFCFVTLTGFLTIGLTILLFISMMGDQSRTDSEAVPPRATASLSREDLERRHEWSAQDRWRIAHFFVPHKPEDHRKTIQLDSRLERIGAERRQWTSSQRQYSTQVSRGAHSGSRSTLTRDFDVQLELGRPHRAEQDQRIVSGIVLDSHHGTKSNHASKIRSRESRAFVQASWEFGADCDQTSYAGLPIRHPTRQRSEPELFAVTPVELPNRRVPTQPTHDPEIESPRWVTPRALPDIDFEMQFIRHFTESAAFPLGSRPFSVSQRSSFSDNDGWTRNASFVGNEWLQRGLASQNEEPRAVPYIGLNELRSQDENEPSDEADPDLPSVAEIDLRLELVAPLSAAAGKINQATLIVSNEGLQAIPRIEVVDALDLLQTVIDADPDGAVELVSDENSQSEWTALHREISELQPGSRRDLSLNWVPKDDSEQAVQTFVIAHVSVGATTEIVPAEPDQPMSSIPAELPPEKHPALACDISYLDRVFVGDDVEMEITVRNTGDTTLHNVNVNIELPDGLSHADGKTVVFHAGNLRVEQQNRSILKTSAKHAGDAVNHLRVASDERIEASGTTRIMIVDRAKQPTGPQPVPQKAAPLPQNNVTPWILGPFINCCCQHVSAVQFVPDSRVP